MLGNATTSSVLGDAVHIIQIALTPVFLLSGIATLLNVFSTRFARVADQIDALAKSVDGGEVPTDAILKHRLAVLRRRSRALDVAVVLAAAGAALTCAAVLALFVGEAGGPAVATMLLLFFGLAIGCTLSAIGAFTIEMLMANRRVRAEAVAEGRTIAWGE
ncbi:MAG TPA: DUF2721 domain-containing protein [Stellaceae bacterium]|jgi:hypothetical protein